MSERTKATDWRGWYDRWEAQQGAYMPDRDERFDVICAAVGAFCGDSPTVVDLGAGPGSLSMRIIEGIPGAQAIAVDMDPVLLAIGRHAHGDAGGHLRFIDADLRDPLERLLPTPVDAVVSTTALHWLQPGALAGLYRRLAAIIRPGGVFLNGDHLGFDAEPRVAAAVKAIRGQREHAGGPGAETWDQWWEAVSREPGLAAEVAERSRRHHDHPDHDHDAGLDFHSRALHDAGFSEVSTLWQHLADRVLVAVH